MAISMDLEVEQMDVKMAFLHDDLKEEIYIEQPEGFQTPGKEEHVCLRFGKGKAKLQGFINNFKKDIY